MGRYDSLPAFPPRHFPAPAAVIYSSSPAPITASSDSGTLDVKDFTVAQLSVFATSVTGTNPTLSVFWDQQDAAGNWLLAQVSLTQLTAAPNYAFAVVGAANSYPLAMNGRVRWTVGGTASPTWTGVTLSLIGR